MMQTRKRSIVSPTSPIRTHKRQKIHNTIMNLQLILSSDSSTLHEKTDKLLTTIFQNMIEGVWLRILPKNDRSDDISTITNIEFDKLFIMMNYLGLVQEIIKDGEKIIAIKYDKWENFRLGKDLYFEPGSENKLKPYFICNNIPQYHSPTRQLKACEKKQFAFERLPF